MYAPIWSSMVGCVFLGRGVLTPHLVFQLASVSDSLYFGLGFVRRIWRLLIDACLSWQVYASNVTGVWLNALCALPSSPGSRRGSSDVGIKTQL